MNEKREDRRASAEENQRQLAEARQYDQQTQTAYSRPSQPNWTLPLKQYADSVERCLTFHGTRLRVPTLSYTFLIPISCRIHFRACPELAGYEYTCLDMPRVLMKLYAPTRIRNSVPCNIKVWGGPHLISFPPFFCLSMDTNLLVSVTRLDIPIMIPIDQLTEFNV